MMRRLWWIALLLFFFTQSAGAAPSQLIMNQENAGSMVRLESDTVAVIELEANPSTGYVWQADLSESGHLKILGRQFVSSNPGMLGSRGIEKIYVAGVSQGQAPLSFALKRTDSAKALKSVTFNFETEGPLLEKFEMPEADNQTDDAPLAAENEAPAIGLPAAYNWCDENGCTPVKNQGNCGSCWAFATVGVFESLIKIKDGTTLDLSEQYLVSCNNEGYGCNGGWWAHDYHQWKYVSGETEAGAVSESTKPYQAVDGTCNPPNAKVAKLSNWAYVGSQSSVPSTTAIKQAIFDHGPVAAAVCVNNAFSGYTGGIFSGPGCSSVNHGINLVGWNDDGGYWILRNSWGGSWGESGYMRIQYGVSSVGFAASYAEYGGDDPGCD